MDKEDQAAERFLQWHLQVVCNEMFGLGLNEVNRLAGGSGIWVV